MTPSRPGLEHSFAEKVAIGSAGIVVGAPLETNDVGDEVGSVYSFADEAVPFTDGFDFGNTTAWSGAVR